MKILLSSVLLVLTTAGLSAAEVGISIDIRLGKVLPPPPPPLVVLDSSGPPGPPPWAPANGFRRNRAYYYYPGADVYFRPADRMWFYLEGPSWRSGASLPDRIAVDFHRSVALTMETESPHQFHDQVRVRYPSDYFTTKARVKDDASDAPGRGQADRSPASAGGNGPANGKGNGRGRGNAR